MATYHPLVNIEINKGYCIRKYSNKTPKEIANKVRELSEDKTNWSDNVMNTIQNIIQQYNYEVPYDIVEPHYNTTKTVNLTLDQAMDKYKRDELVAKMRETVKTIDEDSDANIVQEVYLQSNPKYSEMDDIRIAHLIMLLSKLAKEGKHLWISVYLTIKELKNNLLYFIPDNGRIKLSNKTVNDDPAINDYINSLNELIDGKRELPYR